MKLSLEGKLALVCGASSGIGAAVAIELAELGAKVILLARNEAKLQSVKSKMKNPELHRFITCDLGKLDFSAVEKILHQEEVIEILINNAGGPPGGDIQLAESEAFLKAFQEHVLASQTLAKLLLPGMKKRQFGRIVNIISTSVKAPLPHLGVSNTIRGAMNNWAKTWASEVAPFGITVNSVLPGATETERSETLLANRAKINGHSEEVELAAWKKIIPMGRLARAEEIASVVAFLASPAASYVTGTALCVDGGRTPCV